MAVPDSGKVFWDDEKFTQLYKSVEQFTGQYARLMVNQSGVLQQAEKPDNKLTILDMACGTAVVSSHIMSPLASPSRGNVDLTCADIADSMVAAAQARIEANNWPGKAIKADAQDTKLPSDYFTHIFFNFGPGLLPQPQKGLAECYRMLAPGGIFGLTAWEKIGWLPEMRDCWAQHPSLPRLPNEDEFLSTFSKDGSTWKDAGVIKKYMLDHGFADVRIETPETKTELKSYKQVVAMFPGSLGMMFNHHWTEEERKEHKEKAEAYAEDYLKQKYGDGPIVWEWRAIIATGRKPE